MEGGKKEERERPKEKVGVFLPDFLFFIENTFRLSQTAKLTAQTSSKNVSLFTFNVYLGKMLIVSSIFC